MRVIVFQAVKHLLVGIFATLIDLAVFKLLILIFPPAIAILLIIKGFSFLIAAAVKYWGNKYWAFKKIDLEELPKEISKFFIVTIIGLAIDTVAFFYFSFYFWAEASVIFAAATAAVWNFLGYKFLVFKK